MEDLDTPRVVPGSADAILRTLERLGLGWDGVVVFQSARRPAYEAALATLTSAGRTYPCDCSRRDSAGPYTGACRGRPDVPVPHAIRFALDEHAAPLTFLDRWQGLQSSPRGRIGDPVIRRRDGLAAYQLAVVVDDGFQGITDVVRGADLLVSTFWQIELQAALHLPRPGYAHAPLVTEPSGAKLAKARHSLPLDALDPAESLKTALSLLGQPLEPVRGSQDIEEILTHARAMWRVDSLPRTVATE